MKNKEGLIYFFQILSASEQEWCTARGVKYSSQYFHGPKEIKIILKNSTVSPA